MAAVLACVLLAAGSAAIYFVVTIRPVHRAADTVGSRLATALPDAAPQIDRARALVKDALVAGNIPGLSIAVSRDSRLMWSESFGVADVGSGEPVLPATRFRVGAVSRTLTAAAAGLLRDRGLLAFDAPVQQYVPRYPDTPWPLTAGHLMSDSGGVRHLRDGREVLPSAHCATVSDALDIFREDALAFRPGSARRFSVYGWILMSAVVEGAAREPFDSFMTRQVLGPLGMAHTALDDADVDGRATGYFPRAAENPVYGLQHAPEANYSCFFGAGQYLSTAEDLVRLGGAMVAPGFLTDDTRALLLEPVRFEASERSEFALGWSVDALPVDSGSVQAFSQRGTPLGGTAFLLVVPAQRIAVAVTSNVSYARGVDPLGRAIAGLFAARGA